MGLEDRDWYREEHARRNGMRYNRKNATYSVAKRVIVSSSVNAALARGRFVARNSQWHWSLKFALFLVIVLFVTILIRFVNSLV